MTVRTSVLGAALGAALALASGGPALASRIALYAPETASAPAVLKVTVGGVGQDSFLAPPYSGYGRNLSPPVSWTAGPPGTRAYALMLEDPDGADPDPVVHWTVWNIPAEVRSLPRAVRNAGVLERPAGARQGRNSHGGVGYTGPHPPVGDPPHHFHVQVFALDRDLGLKPEADRSALLRALKGHVLAKGETVVLYKEDPPKPPRG